MTMLARHARRRGRFSAEIVKVARYYLEQFETMEGGFEANGEAWLVRRLARISACRTVLDVGANRGKWTQLVREAAPSAVVHAFEIAPITAHALILRYRADAQVHVNDFGLAEIEDRREIEFFPSHDSLTTLVAGTEAIHGDKERRGETVAVRRGDDYCREQGLDHLDLLKIDVEGAEHLVLTGFESMLEKKRIDVIQFEYGMANIYTHFLLLDHYRFLTAFGYILGKLGRRGVRFQEYKPWEEDFRGSNYVAVLNSRSDLVEALQYRP